MMNFANFAHNSHILNLNQLIMRNSYEVQRSLGFYFWSDNNLCTEGHIWLRFNRAKKG